MLSFKSLHGLIYFIYTTLQEGDTIPTLQMMGWKQWDTRCSLPSWRTKIGAQVGFLCLCLTIPRRLPLNLELKDAQEELLLGRAYGVVKPWKFKGTQFWGDSGNWLWEGKVGVIFAQGKGWSKGCSAMRPEPYQATEECGSFQLGNWRPLKASAWKNYDQGCLWERSRINQLTKWPSWFRLAFKPLTPLPMVQPHFSSSKKELPLEGNHCSMLQGVNKISWGQESQMTI